MKISLNLIKEFADITESHRDVIETVSRKIGEVENVRELGKIYEGIVVGQIEESSPHPEADKLSVNKVNVGKKAAIQVIAGDKSLEKGDKVAYIPPGNVVPVTTGKDEVKLSVRKIRGLDSHGMLASEYELDFSTAHEGVLKLDTPAKPGAPLTELYKLDDYILDVETKVLTHRPDMFGHLGFARELSAALGKRFTSPDWYLKDTHTWPKPENRLDVTIDNRLPELVPRFTLAAYEGVIVGPSPVQVQSWLMRLGIRPLNNIVDLTNYMMILSGQPFHAFDFDKVAGGGHKAEFVVRHPHKGETIKLIDGTQIKPHIQAVLIANDKRPIGLGGVMGGLDTEVDDKTKRVVLEAANFNMYSIRNTSMAHGISSEAVTRFARGQNPEAIASNQRYALNLVREWAGAKPAGGLLDDYPGSNKPKSVSASAAAINSLLGTEYDMKSMKILLENAELEVKLHGQQFTVGIPSWRPDLNIEADIAEEVGRLSGYDNIKTKKPTRSIEPAPRNPLNSFENAVRLTLSAGGANEVLSYSGVPKKLLDASSQDEAQSYRIRNALSTDVELMRLSITPSLLDKIYPNLRQGYDRFAMFELGTVHNKRLIKNKLPDEQYSLALVYAASQKSKTAKSGAAYYMAKVYLEHLLSTLGFDWTLVSSRGRGDPWLEQASAPYDDARSAYISVAGRTVGLIGEFTPRTSRELRLPELTAGFELHSSRLLETRKSAPRYKRLSKYPPVMVDLTLKTPLELPFAKLESAVKSTSVEGVELELEPLEIFTPDKSHKHTTFRLRFVHHERTLRQKEVNQWLDKIVKSVHKKTGATQV